MIDESLITTPGTFRGCFFGGACESHMQRAELLSELKTSRDEIEDLLEGAPEEALTVSGAIGEWSVKDLLAHLAGWDAELITALAKLKQGVRSDLFNFWPDEKVNAANARIYQENRGRPLERVLVDFRGARKQLIRQVETLSQKELDAVISKQTRRSLAEEIWHDSVEHDAEHLPELRAWAKERRGAKSDPDKVGAGGR